MTDDLDDLIRRTDPDRWLASRFIGDVQARADVIALYAYDYELARAPKVASTSLLGEIRLTWWREVLDEMFEGRPVRRHPTAQALADVAARHGLPREPLEAMIDARYAELDSAPLSAEAAHDAAKAAEGCARAAMMVLGAPAESSMAPGWAAAWALARLIEAGRVDPAAVDALRAHVRLALADARSVERDYLSAEAFPAIAHATLARAYAAGRAPGPTQKRLRLIWAVARGRI